MYQTMPQTSWAISLFPIVILFGIMTLFILAVIYKRYLASSFGKGLLVSFIAIIACFAAILTPILLITYADQQHQVVKLTTSLVLVNYIPRGLLFLFAVPFAFKMFDKWINNRLTDQESIPGVDGVRAWLGAGNVICIIGIAFCAWKGYESSFWLTLFILLALTIAYPIINLLSHRGTAPREDLSRARDKILQMLEEGKISSAESAELLKALGERDEQKDQ